MSKKNKTYSVELKLQAVKMYIEDRIRSPTIAKKFGLNTNKRVLLWVKIYKEFGIDGLTERRGKANGANKGRPGKFELTLEEEN